MSFRNNNLSQPIALVDKLTPSKPAPVKYNFIPPFLNRGFTDSVYTTSSGHPQDPLPENWRTKINLRTLEVSEKEYFH